MFRRTVVLLLLSLVTLACGARSRGASRGPDRRAMVRLERQAQRDMSCRTPLHVTTLETRAYQLDGCGQMREYAWVCSGRRCVFEPIIPAVVRAAADLQCAPDQLAGQADAPTHRAFFGCMRGAAYTLMCLDHGCTWSRTQEAVTMAQPQPTFASIGGTAPIADPTLEGVAIPPPPGAPSAFGSAPPPTEVPAPQSQAIVPPPPTGSTAPTAPTPPPSADTVVIPPPPS